MRTCILLLSTALLLGLPAHADELLTNGDFEAPLTPGWEEIIVGTGSVDRGTGFHPDDDYEVRVYKPSITGEVTLLQTVAVLGADVSFAASTRLRADATGDAWSVAALRIGYLDAGGATLGETCICARSRNCPWEDTPTLHIIEPDPNLWLDHGFRIDEELAHLPGVDPLCIDSVRIALYTYAYVC